MKTIHMKLWVVLLILIHLLIISRTHAAQLADQVNKKLKEYDSTVAPGFALAIIKEGKIIYKRGFGMANLEYGIPITPKSVFRIGSTSKQFTAMCILLLEEQGKLSLDDDIRKYIPEIPQYESPITIRHLIHHTSGLRDYLTLQYLRGIGDDEYYTVDDALTLLSGQKQLNFEPGAEHLYSNSGYFLLSVIVECVSGQTLAEFAHKNIFQALGMTQTHYHDNHSRIVKNRATGYSKTENGYRIDETILDITGDGAVFTTVEDLFLWDQNFYHNQLGQKNPNLIQKMLTRGVLNNGDTLSYAFGLNVGRYKGLPVVSHGGAFVGFRAQMIRFPEQEFSVICLANLSSINPTSVCYQVADIYLKNFYVKEKSKVTVQTKTKKLSAKKLQNMIGTFYNSESGRLARVRFEEAKLWLDARDLKVELAAISQNKFMTVNAPFDAEVEFLDKNKNKYQKMSIQLPDRAPIQLEAIVPVTLNAAQRKAYTGQYYSEELDVNYTIIVENQQLLIKVGRKRTHPLQAIIEDHFRIRQMGLGMYFERNQNNQLTGFSLKAGRVKNIRFRKKSHE